MHLRVEKESAVQQAVPDAGPVRLCIFAQGVPAILRGTKARARYEKKKWSIAQQGPHTISGRLC